MGFATQNINIGYNYHEYLRKQLEQHNDAKLRIEQKAQRHLEYNMKGLTPEQISIQEQPFKDAMHKEQQDNLARYTRCSGAIADRLGLSGHLTAEKLKVIGDLEIGKHDETAKDVKIQEKKVYTINDKSTAHVVDETTKENVYLNETDLKNGFYTNEYDEKIPFKNDSVQYFKIYLTQKDLANGYVNNHNGEQVFFDKKDVVEGVEQQRKTSTEFCYSLDSTFSYFYQSLDDDGKRKMEQIFMDAMDESFNNVVQKEIKNSKGQTGELLTYTTVHVDNRDGNPFLHGHYNCSNLNRVDGEYGATEIDAIKEPGFHNMVNAKFQSSFIQKFTETFKDVPVESYDREKKSVLNHNQQQTKDFRVAYNKESLNKIYSMSKTGEKVDAVVKQQLADNENRYNKTIKDLKEQKESHEITDDAFYKKSNIAQQKFQKEIKRINSGKNKSKIKNEIKKAKTDESFTDKITRNDDLVKSFGLEYKKKGVDEIGILYSKKGLSKDTDSHVIKNVTATKPYFSEHDFVAEYINHYGPDAENRAIQLIKDAKAGNGLSNKNADIIAHVEQDKYGRDKFTFTSRELITKEHDNIKVMRKMMTKDSKTHIEKEKLEKQVKELLQKLSDDNRKKELEKGTKESEIKDIKFSQGQRDLIDVVFNEKNAGICIGVPGSGKSFSINASSIIAKQNGFTTYGIAPTNKVKADLGTTDIGKDNAFTVQAFNIGIQNNKIHLDEKSIVFLDESSMVDTRTFHDLMQNIDRTGAKLVLIGDSNQISAVGAGQTLTEYLQDSEITKHKENFAILDEITRQKDSVSLEIAKSTSLANVYRNGNVDELKESGEHIKKAFQLLEDNGRMHLCETSEQKLNMLVHDYMADDKPCNEKLALASLNKSVDAINTAIQDERLKKGQLSEQSLSNGDKDFHVGDRIILKENIKDKEQGYSNGDVGTIKEFVNGVAVVSLDNGTERNVSIKNNDKIDLGYCLTGHKSQGLTTGNTYNFAEVSSLASSNMTNVIFTRNKFDIHNYATHAEYDAVKECYSRKDSKMLLTDIGKQNGIQLDEPQKLTVSHENHEKEIGFKINIEPKQEQQHHNQEQQQPSLDGKNAPEQSQKQQVKFATVEPKQDKNPEQKQGFLSKAKDKLYESFKQFDPEYQKQQKELKEQQEREKQQKIERQKEYERQIAEYRNNNPEMPESIKALKGQEHMQQSPQHQQGIKQQQEQSQQQKLPEQFDVNKVSDVRVQTIKKKQDRGHSYGL